MLKKFIPAMAAQSAAFALVLCLSAPATAAGRLGIADMLPREQIAQAETAPAQKFSGNVKTLKFHKESCKHFRCKTCTKFFRTEEEAVGAGYERCGWCWK